MSNLARSLLLASCLGALLCSAVARADHGASDERVSLPDGPGSIGGVGDNVDVDANMGSMSTSVVFELPVGLEGSTPSLSLEYSSAAGTGVVGYGWAVPVSSIERMRSRGLPVYDETDEIVVDGGSELVRVGTLDGGALYRARYEGSFVRYRWHDSAGGTAGYWTAERPDGSVAYYGADETGAGVRAARVETAAGEVYRWHLVAVLDRFEHAVRYAYTKDGETSLLDSVSYAFTDAGTARFDVRFAYEARPDPITTGEPGFLLALRQRLREVQIRSGSETIRRYLVSYEDTSTSGGASRLARVEQRGRGDATTPVQFAFQYSRSLDGSCPGTCDGPFVVDMGSLPAGVDLRSGRATLIDMNGDALPDVVSTSETGRHTIVPTRIDPATGAPSFDAAYASTATPTSTAFVLGAPGVQVLDVDGDGFTDMIESRNGDVLCNEGTGDWSGTACLMNSTLPVLEQDTMGDANPRYVRFLDYDDDRRIDMIRTLPTETEVYVNTGSSFVQQAVDPIGAQFDVSPTLQLADMNGDGLQDPVEILTGATQLQYRYNLGFGRWTDWITIAISGFGSGDLELLQVEDINGDGLADIVLVAGIELRYAINRGDRFDPAVTVTSADVGGDLPERVTDSTVVLFADMNGNGSRDVVWVTGSRVHFLELFPTRPNLISRVENGLGSVQDVAYGSSVLQQARDRGTADAWEHLLPYPVNVVVGLDQWNRLTGGEGGVGLHDELEIVYRDGFYDGTERSFRGFAVVERIETSDPEVDHEAGARTVTSFDVGAEDAYRAGRMLHEASFEGAPGAWLPMQETFVTWADCPLSGIPTSGLSRPVRFVCETLREEIDQEGAAETEWATIRTELEHDGYGQVTRSIAHGVIHLGPPSAPIACGACGEGSGPCGSECLGDEVTREVELVEPGVATANAWILGIAVRERTSGGDDLETEVVHRYDGPDFVGLAEGRLERGARTSTRVRTSSGDEWFYAMRVRRDAHGNVVEEILPDGDTDDADAYRRVYVHDADHLRVVREEMLFRDGEGRAARLRRDTAYDSVLLVPTEETAWMLVRGDDVLTPRNARRSRYDAFGRPIALLESGDADATPTQEYEYLLGSPVSRIVVRARTEMGGPLATEEIQCFDGLGRRVQSRTRVADGDYQVSQYAELNRSGNPVRIYQPYRSASAECDTSPPSSRYVEYTYDSQGRAARVTFPDDDVHGTRSITRTEHAPLRVRTWDADDADDASPHAGTPTERVFDGLDRLVEIHRDLGDHIATTRLRYDALGRLVAVVDPIGQEHLQTYDLAGRVTSVTDPSTGTITYVRDAGGRVIERRDSRGRRLASEYDALGRTVAQWDPADEEATRTALTYDLDEACDACSNAAGRLASARYPLGTLGEGRDEIGYDARGRTVWQGRTIEGHRYEIAHELDGFGRLLRSTMPGGIVIERGYDDASRPTSIGGVLDDVTYDERGNVATLFYTNGVRTERTYDGASRLDELRTLEGGVVLQGNAYTRSRTGDVLAMRDLADATGDDAPDLGGTFEYDAWHRLVRAAFGAGDAPTEELTVEYDLGDRVLRRDSSLGAASRAHVGALEYDADRPDQVVRAGDRAYEHDSAGNMTVRGATRLTWDHLGRMTEAQTDEETSQLYYGAGVDRVAKVEDGGTTIYLSPEAEVRDGVVYVYPRLLQWRLARRRSTSIQTEVLSDVAPRGAVDGEIGAADAWLAHAAAAEIVPDVGETSDVRRLLRGAARRLLVEDGGDLAYLHHDHLGSVTLATDADGAEIGEVAFYPNGEIRYRSGFTDEHGFTGQEQDASTGLIAFRYRQLDPEIGRWASADPAFAVLTPESVDDGGAEATSEYSYVGNHVINALDPDGLASKTVGQRLAAFGRSVRDGLRPRAIGQRLQAAGRWAKNNKLATAVLVVGIVAAALLSAGTAVAIVVAVAIATASAVAGLMLGRAIKKAWANYQVGRTPLSPTTRTLLDRIGKGILYAGAAATVVAFAVGLTVVTGGGALIAGAIGVSVWATATSIATNTITEVAVGVTDVVGATASSRVEVSDAEAARAAGQRRNAFDTAQHYRGQLMPDQAYPAGRGDWSRHTGE